MSIAKLPIQTTHDNNVPNIEIRNYRYLFPSTTDHCTLYSVQVHLSTVFFPTIYSCPGRCAYTILGTFLCTYEQYRYDTAS